jgi:hypothetical protein
LPATSSSPLFISSRKAAKKAPPVSVFSASASASVALCASAFFAASTKCSLERIAKRWKARLLASALTRTCAEERAAVAGERRARRRVSRRRRRAAKSAARRVAAHLVEQVVHHAPEEGHGVVAPVEVRP